MKLLIDADFIVYKCCAAAETEIDWSEDVVLVTSRFSEAYKAVLHEIMRIKDEFSEATDTILFFSHFDNLGRKFSQNTRGIEIERSPVVINESYQRYMTTTK